MTIPSPVTTPDGLEPRFALPPTTPRSSKKAMAIGGVQVYVYGLDEIRDADEVVVLYLAHNRTRTYLVTEGIAHEVLHRYRRSGRIAMIGVTMNMRNHGDREICPDANRTWENGNENHGMDLISTIEGATHDFRLLLDLLPCYLPQFKTFHNVMMGVSLGGHTAWRMPALAPGKLDALAIVVGCPDLTSLLLDRLGVGETVTDDMTYDGLAAHMTEQQRARWPRPLFDLVRDGDRKIRDEFPELPMLLCNGKYDALVPAGYTVSWVEMKKRARTSLYVQDNTGHSCTKEMVAMIADWLGDLYGQ